MLLQLLIKKIIGRVKVIMSKIIHPIVTRGMPHIFGSIQMVIKSFRTFRKANLARIIKNMVRVLTMSKIWIIVMYSSLNIPIGACRSTERLYMKIKFTVLKGSSNQITVNK